MNEYPHSLTVIKLKSKVSPRICTRSSYDSSTHFWFSIGTEAFTEITTLFSACAANTESAAATNNAIVFFM